MNNKCLWFKKEKHDSPGNINNLIKLNNWAQYHNHHNWKHFMKTRHIFVCQTCCSCILRSPDPKYENASLEMIHVDLQQWSNVRTSFVCFSFLLGPLVLVPLLSVLCLLLLKVIFVIMCLMLSGFVPETRQNSLDLSANTVGREAQFFNNV